MLGRYQCAEGLRKVELKVVAHDEIFPQNTADVDWIRRCAAEGWVIVTGDHWKRGRREAAQIKAVAVGKVRVFQLATNDIPAELWSQAIIKAEKKIWKILKMNRGPFMARIRPGGPQGKINEWSLGALRALSRDL